MISFFKERDFLNNNCSTKERTKEKERTKRQTKKKIQKGRHFSSKSHTYPLRAKTLLFSRGIIRRLLKMDGTLPFILSLFFQSLVFSLLIFVLRLDFSRDDLRKCPFLNIFSLYEESYE